MTDWRMVIAMARHLGPWRTIVFFAAVLTPVAGLVALDTWLSGIIGWPEAYGFSCHGRCLIQNMVVSPRLLVHHSLAELGLFGVIWIIPFVAGSGMGILLLRRKITARQRCIRPMD